MLVCIISGLIIFVITLFYYISKIKGFKCDIDNWMKSFLNGKEDEKIYKTFYNLYTCAPILSFSLGIVLCLVYYWLNITYDFGYSTIFVLGMILGIAVVASACLRKYPTKYAEKYTHNALYVKIRGNKITIQLTTPDISASNMRILTAEEIDELVKDEKEKKKEKID